MAAKSSWIEIGWRTNMEATTSRWLRSRRGLKSLPRKYDMTISMPMAAKSSWIEIYFRLLFASMPLADGCEVVVD